MALNALGLIGEIDENLEDENLAESINLQISLEHEPGKASTKEALSDLKDTLEALFEVDSGQITIGRDLLKKLEHEEATNKGPWRKVSGKHVTIRNHGNGVISMEDSSLNGTFVNDKRLPKDRERLIPPGSEIAIPTSEENGRMVFITPRLEQEEIISIAEIKKPEATLLAEEISRHTAERLVAKFASMEEGDEITLERQDFGVDGAIQPYIETRIAGISSKDVVTVTKRWGDRFEITAPNKRHGISYTSKGQAEAMDLKYTTDLFAGDTLLIKTSPKEITDTEGAFIAIPLPVSKS